MSSSFLSFRLSQSLSRGGSVEMHAGKCSVCAVSRVGELKGGNG